MESALDEVALDPTFSDFASWCASKKIPLIVVSEGLGPVIKRLFKRDNIQVKEVWANELSEKPSGELSLSFPYPPQDKDCRAGLCKCLLLSQTNSLNVVIGDGRSDFCWSGKADLVFAKSTLLTYCDEFKIPYQSFQDFEEVRFRLEKILKKTSKTHSTKVTL